MNDATQAMLNFTVAHFRYMEYDIAWTTDDVRNYWFSMAIDTRDAGEDWRVIMDTSAILYTVDWETIAYRLNHYMTDIFNEAIENQC